MKHSILIFSIVLANSLANAQSDRRLSGTYNGVPLLNLVSDIESKTNYKFFFDEAWTDSLKITLSFQDELIPVIVQKALENSPLHYFIMDNHIVLTQNIDILDKIDAELFVDARYSSNPKGNYSFQRELISQAEDISKKNTMIEVGTKGQANSETIVLVGYVRERKSGEAIPGALVYIPETNKSSNADAYGFYSLSLKPGSYTMAVRFVGMNDVSQPVLIHSDGKLNFLMEEKVTVLKEITVESDRDQNVSNTQMGTNRIDVRSLKNIPKVLGENDIFKVATTLPGVKTVGEGSSGINVRGGNSDQNLVVLNEATIYNTSHFLGFFSVFNADAIKSFELYKSGIPARYGGRLSSVFEIQMKDGNQKKFSGQGGIGPITSHLTFEVPLKKDKTSLMFGTRSTYSNWVLRQVPNPSIRKSKASFYDFFTRLTHNLNDKNSIYLSLYYSHDQYNLSTDSTFSYHNALGSLQWRHIFTNQHSALLSISQSNYQYQLAYEKVPTNSFDLGFRVKESHVKWDFNYHQNKHQVEYGIEGKLYEVNPGYIQKSFKESIINERVVQKEKGLESALYFSDDIEITPNFSLYAGLRYSHFLALGPRIVYQYKDGYPKGDNTIIDTLHYSEHSVIKTNHGPEYRLAARYKLSEDASLKISYNRTRQYIHMLSNTVSVSPTNTWKLSDANIAPQVADQISIGFFKDLRNKTVELSVELYRKWLNNVIDYKTGSALLLNQNIEQDILQGKGKAYGIEILLRKKAGKLNGWIGYTYSRTFLKLNGNSTEEKVNGGKYFPANYDKPHDFSLVTNYKITRRYSFSLNFLYSSGRPITYPNGLYKFGDTYRINYSNRNQYRIPDYARIDLGFNMEGNHRVKKLAHSFWSISIYNLLGRKNPYSIYFKVENDKIKAYKLSIFGAAIPTITYNFRF